MTFFALVEEPLHFLQTALALSLEIMESWICAGRGRKWVGVMLGWAGLERAEQHTPDPQWGPERLGRSM